jgi:hypothetical protein
MDTLITALAQFDAIKREVSSKLFFKIYPYRILIDAFKLKKIPNTYGIPSHRSAVDTLVAGAAIQGGHRIRHQGGFANIYFVEAGEAARFVSENAGVIIAVALPESTEAFAALTSDTRVEIRDTLFWGKFRWAAVCKPLTGEEVEELREWISNYKAQIEDDNDKIQFSYSTSSPRIFFSEEDDLFMFKFAYFNRISRLEKVLLRKEISNEHVFAEGSH